MRKSLSLALASAALLAGCAGDPSPAPPVASPTGPSPGAPPRPSPSQAPAEETALAAGHPRLWLTAEDLPRLRSWATPANPIWQHGIAVAAQGGPRDLRQGLLPRRAAEPEAGPTRASTTGSRRATEAYAEFFAFLSLVDPRPDRARARTRPAREAPPHARHPTRRRRASTGGQNPAPFRGPALRHVQPRELLGRGASGSRWTGSTRRSTPRTRRRSASVFLRWADENVHAATSRQEHPQPIGAPERPAPARRPGAAPLGRRTTTSPATCGSSRSWPRASTRPTIRRSTPRCPRTSSATRCEATSTTPSARGSTSSTRSTRIRRSRPARLGVPADGHRRRERRALAGGVPLRRARSTCCTRRCSRSTRRATAIRSASGRRSSSSTAATGTGASRASSSRSRPRRISCPR